MIGELYIDDVLIDLDEVINFPITYSIADITDPTKRRRSTSKTISIKGTKNNLNFFSSAYEIGAYDPENTGVGFEFDATLLHTARYYKQGTLIFNGAMRLLSVSKENDNYTFDISLFSNTVSIDKRLNNLTIPELGWSEYDHLLNLTNVQNSWSAPTGTGYVYGLINFGYDNNFTTYQTNQLIPYVYQHEILTKAFNYLGYTIDSTTLDNTDFKKKVYGSGGGVILSLDSTEISNRLSDFDFEHGYDGINTNPYFARRDTTLNQTTFNYRGWNYEKLGSLSTGDYTINNDTYGQVDSTGGAFILGSMTVANNGNYRFTYDATSIDIKARHVGLADVDINLNIRWIFKIYKNGVEIANTLIERNPTGTSAGTFNFSETIATSVVAESTCLAGDLIETGLIVDVNNSTVVSSSLDTQLWKFYSLSAWAEATAQTINFKLECLDNEFTDGNTVQLSRFLPPVNVSTFINDIITTNNLYVSEPDINNVIKIESYQNYYYGSNFARDWTKKQAKNQRVNILPPKTDVKNYIFKFEPDNDYYNKLYRDTFGRGYGDYNLELNTDITSGSKIWKTHFSQSLPVQVKDSDGVNDPLIIPCILQVNEVTGAQSPYKGKPRVFYYNGLQNCVTWNLEATNGLTTVALNEYPQFSHLNSLSAPTKDYNFGKPDKVYFDTTVYTNNNLVQENYTPMLTELTNKAAKTVSMYFKIDNTDLTGEFMRYPILVDENLFRINLISEYDGLSDQLTKVELIRVIEGRKVNTNDVFPGVPGSPNDTTEGLVTNESDYQSGFNTIVEEKTITIPENKQSTNFGGLDIEGILITDGDLILEE